jgi:hypothetical protein
MLQIVIDTWYVYLPKCLSNGKLTEYLPLAWQPFLISIISSLIPTGCKFIFQQQSTLVQQNKTTPAISYSCTQTIIRNAQGCEHQKYNTQYVCNSGSFTQ